MRSEYNGQCSCTWLLIRSIHFKIRSLQKKNTDIKFWPAIYLCFIMILMWVKEQATPGFPLLRGYNTRDRASSVCDVKQGFTWLRQQVVVWYYKYGSDGLTSGEGRGGELELGSYVWPLYERAISNLDVMRDEETMKGAMQHNLKSPPKRRDLGENWYLFLKKGCATWSCGNSGIYVRKFWEVKYLLNRMLAFSYKGLKLLSIMKYVYEVQFFLSSWRYHNSSTNFQVEI